MLLVKQGQFQRKSDNIINPTATIQPITKCLNQKNRNLTAVLVFWSNVHFLPFF